MTSRSLAVLAVMTAVTVVLAAVSLLSRTDIVTTDRLMERAFPELASRANEVVEISLTDGEGTATVRRDGESWGLAERAGYPVDTEQVRRVVLRLAETRLVEAKTNQPDRYVRLEVEDPDSEGARSRLLSLKDAQGETIAVAIIGKRNPRLFGPGRSGIYLRRQGEGQAWLTDGDLDLSSDVWDWLERTILNVSQRDVAEVVIERNGKETIRVTQESEGSNAFTLAQVPEGEEADTDALGRLAGTLSFVSVDDIKPAAELEFPDKPGVATFTTFDGLRVRITYAIVKAQTWGVIEASVLAPAKADHLEDGASPPEADAGASAVAEKAAEINGRTEGWVFRLAAYQRQRLFSRVKDLLVKEDDGTS